MDLFFKNSSCASKIRMRYHSATVFGLPCSVVRLYVVKIFTMFVSSLGRAMITYKWLNAQSRWDPVKTAPASSATITRRWKTGKTAIKTLFDSIFVSSLFLFSGWTCFVVYLSAVILMRSRRKRIWAQILEIAPDDLVFSTLGDVSLANAKRYTNTAEKKGGSRVTGRRRRKNKNNNKKKGLPYFYGPPFYFIPFFFFGLSPSYIAGWHP